MRPVLGYRSWHCTVELLRAVDLVMGDLLGAHAASPCPLLCSALQAYSAMMMDEQRQAILIR